MCFCGRWDGSPGITDYGKRRGFCFHVNKLLSVSLCNLQLLLICPGLQRRTGSERDGRRRDGRERRMKKERKKVRRRGWAKSGWTTSVHGVHMRSFTSTQALRSIFYLLLKKLCYRSAPLFQFPSWDLILIWCLLEGCKSFFDLWNMLHMFVHLKVQYVRILLLLMQMYTHIFW